MRNVWVVALGAVMFVLGAYSAPLLRAQPQRERPRDGRIDVAERALLPEQPIQRVVVRTPGHDDCEVEAVIQEWVKCRERPTWRNLYNGAAYSILK
jgi:hypothetical protein